MVILIYIIIIIKMFNHRHHRHNILFSAPGKSGSVGPSGLPGAIGSCCPNGSTGPSGYQGLTGPNGFQGATGVLGLIGATGVSLQGLIGFTGPQGLTGLGCTVGGAIGATGPTGYIGYTGPIGPSGLIGLQGLPGTTSNGIMGFQGATGGSVNCQKTSRTLFVDPNFINTDNRHFATITDALNYAPNLSPTATNPVEIIIYAETYTEDLTLVANVNLTGYLGSVRVLGNVTITGSTILQNITFGVNRFVSNFTITITTTGNSTVTFSTCTCSVSISLTAKMASSDFFNFVNDGFIYGDTSIYENSTGNGPTIYIANSTIYRNITFGSNDSDETTKGIINNVIFPDPSGSILFQSGTASLFTLNNCTINISDFQVNNGNININNCNIVISDSNTATFNNVTINNSTITACIMNFLNVNATNTSFTTTATGPLNSNLYVFYSILGNFTGSNNTFSDNGALTTGPYMYFLSFISNNSVFNITGAITSTQDQLFRVPSFTANNSVFNIPVFNVSNSEYVFGNGSYTLSGSNFTIGGSNTTNANTINIFDVDSINIIARNCIFDCSTMIQVGFANISNSNSYMDISNSVIDMTNDENASAIIINYGTLVAANCTFINQAGVSSQSFISNRSTEGVKANANLMGCNFRTSGIQIISGDSNTDISPYFFQVNGNGSINPSLGINYKDTNYSASIVPYDITVTGPYGPFISSIDLSDIGCYLPQQGTYNVVCTRQTSTI